MSWLVLPHYNLEQNILNKSTKLSSIDFSMESFTADYLPFCRTTVNICFFDGRLSTFSSIPKILGISLKSLKLLRSYVLSRSATRELNQILWWMGIAKTCKSFLQWNIYEIWNSFSIIAACLWERTQHGWLNQLVSCRHSRRSIESHCMHQLIWSNNMIWMDKYLMKIMTNNASEHAAILTYPNSKFEWLNNLVENLLKVISVYFY